MILDWIKTLDPKIKTRNRILAKELIGLMGLVLGGATVGNYPEEFKTFLTTWIGQYIVILMINYGLYYEEEGRTLKEVVIETAMDVIILQMVKIVLEKYYSKG